MNPLAQDFKFLSLLKFTLPTIVMMIFLSLYTMVDGVMVSHFWGEHALSAVNIVYPIMSIVVAISIMLVSGASAIIGRELGEGLKNLARRHFTFIIAVGMVIGLLLALVGTYFVEDIVYALNSAPETYEHGVKYLYYIALGSPFAVLQMMFQFLFVTAGKPKLGLISTGLGGVLNILFDYIFMGPMGMGTEGAAIATVIGYAVPAIWGLIYFTINTKGELYFVRPKFYGKMLLRSCANGSSEMVTNLASAITIYLFNEATYDYIGLDGVAAITAVLYSQFLMLAVFLGFSQGVAPVISYNYGASNTAGLKKIFRISLTFIILASVTTVILSMLLADPISDIFFDRNTTTFDLSKEAFLLFSINYLFSGINIFSSSMFTAFSNGVVSAIISFMRTFLFLVVSILFLPTILGKTGIWLSVPIAELLTISVAVIFIVRYKKIYNY